MTVRIHNCIAWQNCEQRNFPSSLSLSLSSTHLFLYSRCLHSTLPPTLRWRAFALPFIGISNHRGIPSTYQRCSSARRRARECIVSWKSRDLFFPFPPFQPSCCDTRSGVFSSFFFLLSFFFRIVWFFLLIFNSLGLWKVVCWPRWWKFQQGAGRWKFRWGAIEVDGNDTDKGSIRPPSRVKGRSVIMYTSQTSG